MGLLFALFTAMCWAAYNIAVRQGMQSISGGAGYVVTLLFGTVANAVLLFMPLPGRQPGLPGASALLWFALAGASTTLLGRWVYFRSLAALGPSRASTWKNASPIYTLVLAALLLGERPGVGSLVGTAAAMSGLLVLAGEHAGGKGEAAPSRTNVLLGVASGMAFASGMLLRKAGLNHWSDPAMGSAIGAVTALLCYLPFGLASGDFKAALKGPRSGIMAFVVAGTFSTAAQVFTFLSLRVTATATTHVIASLEPIFTMALSVWLLGRHERMTVRLAGSAVLVSLGVVLMARG